MSNPSKQTFQNEAQKQRWLKYGANVALASIVIILLAGLVTYLAQKWDHRIDTTAAGLYSLKPQTINIIKDNKQKIKLVSLYAAKDERQRDNPYAGPVRDLLEEYSRKGKNIEFQAIDPVTQPTDALLKDAISKYGGAVANYKKFVDDFGQTYNKLKDMTSAEAAALADMKTENLGDAAEIVETIRDEIPTMLTQMKDRLDRSSKVQFPDYKAIIDRLKGTSDATERANLDSISQLEGQLAKLSDSLKDKEKGKANIPDAVLKYLDESAPRHAAIKKLVDDTMKQADGLGELKVGDLQQAMKEANLILVLGETEWKVINPAQVWVNDTRDLRNYSEGQEIKPRFAGEQAVTTAILALTSPAKQKVVFVRPGGRPLTNPGFPPFQAGGPFSELAARLRDYNFDVFEKDLSGMYAMQAQMQGQQVEPEPSDDAIKDAIWVVFDIPSQSQQGQPPATIGPKVADHLKNGGAALILCIPDSDALTDALKDYGVEMAVDATIVHEPTPPQANETGDFAEDVQRDARVFALNRYGDAMLAGPVQSLDSILAQGVPVKLTPVAGAKQWPLMPIPTFTKTWGERDSASLENGAPKFDTTGPNADIPPPLYAGAVVEKDKTRLVVIGDLVGFTTGAMNIRDKKMLERRILVPRYPGNGELFNNSIFWLAHMEPMIAISPAAMQVGRIADMSDTLQDILKFGALIVPSILVLGAGIWMYFARRD